MYQENVYKSYIHLIHIEDLALNNLQWLICHKTQTNQTTNPELCLPRIWCLQEFYGKPLTSYWCACPAAIQIFLSVIREPSTNKSGNSEKLSSAG